MAIAHDRHTVTDAEKLLQFVGNEDHGNLLCRQPADDPIELLDFLVRQRGSRLVHNDDPRLVRNGPGDLYQLHLGNAQALDKRFGGDVDLQRAQQFPGHLHALCIADHPQAIGEQMFAAEPDIFGDAHLMHQVDLLMDHRDAVV